MGDANFVAVDETVFRALAIDEPVSIVVPPLGPLSSSNQLRS